MFRQSPRRNQRNNGGVKLKHVLQMSLLLGVAIWLLVQMQRSSSKKASAQESLKFSEMMQYDDENIKFGRKDLKLKTEVYSEDEKPIEGHPHFDDESKLGEHEREQENTDAIQHTDYVNTVRTNAIQHMETYANSVNANAIQHVGNYVNNVKETETEEGGVATEGHVEENEDDKDNDTLDQMNDNGNVYEDRDKVGSSNGKANEAENGKQNTLIDKSIEGENGTWNSRIYEGEGIGNEGTSIKVKKDMEKYVDKVDIVGSNEGKSEEIAQPNESKDINKTEDLPLRLTKGDEFVEKKVEQQRKSIENEGKDKANVDLRQYATDGEGFVENNIARKGHDGENEETGKLNEDSRQKSTQDDRVVQKKVGQERNIGENNVGNGKVSEDSKQKPLDQNEFIEKKVSKEMKDGENEGKGKVSEDAKISIEDNNDSMGKKVGQEKNDAEEKGKRKSAAMDGGGNIEQVEKQNDCLIGKLSFIEGKLSGTTDKFNNSLKKNNYDGGEVLDSISTKSQNVTEAERGSENEKMASEEHEVEKRRISKKNSMKMNEKEVPLNSGYDFKQNDDSILQPNGGDNWNEKTNINADKSNSTLALPSTKEKLDVVYGNSNGLENAESGIVQGQNVEAKPSGDAEDHSSIIEINTFNGNHMTSNNTKLGEKTHCFKDSNEDDGVHSSVENFSHISTSSNEVTQSINEMVDRTLEIETESSSSTLSEEEKEARTDLDTLPETGNNANNNNDAIAK